MSSERERFDDERGKSIMRGEAHNSKKGRGRENCAACNYYRRGCKRECPFSPYFSPNEHQKFAAVHRLFGGSKFIKIIKAAPESSRNYAAESMIFEANARIRDPVYGSMGIISSLEKRIAAEEAELNAIMARKDRLMRELTSHQPLIQSITAVTISSHPKIIHHGGINQEREKIN